LVRAILARPERDGCRRGRQRERGFAPAEGLPAIRVGSAAARGAGHKDCSIAETVTHDRVGSIQGA